MPSILLEDFEGDPRIADGTVDMGADEFHPHLYCTGDVLPGSKVTVKVISQPGSGVILGEGSGVRLIPKQTPYGLFYLKSPVTQYPLRTVPFHGVCVSRVDVPAGWSTGEEHPFQAITNSILTNLMVLTVK